MHTPEIRKLAGAGAEPTPMTRVFHRMLVVFALLIGPTYCTGSGLGTAMQAFDEGRYPDAIDEFRRAEPALLDVSRAELTRYALYRGLTHLALGDARAASYWLGFAKRTSEREPALLSAEDRDRLASAWRSMGRMPGQ